MVGRIRALFAAAGVAALVAPVAASATEVLVLNSDRVLNESAVGEHIRERLEEIAGEMQAELEAQGTPLQERWQSFQEDTQNLTAEDLEDRPELIEQGRELQGEIFQLNVTEQVLARELIATRVNALRPVRETLDEILQEVVDDRGADILVERSVLIFSSDAVNITDDVIERLNEALPTVDVERVAIPVEEIEGEGDE